MTKKEYTENRKRKNLKQILLTDAEFELYNRFNMNYLIHEVLKSSVRISSVKKYIEKLNNMESTIDEK